MEENLIKEIEKELESKEKKVEIIIKMEHNKGIEEYLLNLLFRMIKILLIIWLFYLIYNNLNPTIKIF